MDRLETHLMTIENKLKEGSATPAPYNIRDRLDWHLTKIEDLISGGGEPLPENILTTDDVDSSVSESSTNPVQNRAITRHINQSVSVKADLVDGKVPADQLPSYVDDVVEYASESAFPAEGETGKIYVALDTNLCYRWSGSEYVQVNAKDCVLNYQNAAAFPVTGTLNVIYIADDTNKQYRWNGTTYVELSVEDDVEVVNYSGSLRLSNDQIEKAKKNKLVIREQTFGINCYFSQKNSNYLWFRGLSSRNTIGNAFDYIGDIITVTIEVNLSDGSCYRSTNALSEYFVRDNTNNTFLATDIPDVSSKKIVRALNLARTQAMMAPNYDATATYALGDYCIHENILYKCTTTITTAEAWTAAHWTQVTASTEFGNATALTPEEVESILKYGAIVSTTLADNSWATIRKVCEMGDAGDFWSVGDTKTDVGTDGTTRTFRICDMTGLYGKHVIFEQVELEADVYRWNPSANTDTSGACNNYSISDMKTTHLPAILLKYSADLQAVMTDTNVKVATNGDNGTLLDVTGKLFLPAEKEISTTQRYSRNEEFTALQTFQYYQTHNTDGDRVKYKGGSATLWWERSPESGYNNYACFVHSEGYLGNYGLTFSNLGVAPFFSF